jgi:hypothetical protein
MLLPKWLERNARTGERKKFTAPEVLRGQFPADEKYTESRISKTAVLKMKRRQREKKSPAPIFSAICLSGS